MASKLENLVALGLHLSAGASDKYLTSAEYVFDESKEQSIQQSLDALFAAVGGSSHGSVSNIEINAAGTVITVTFADASTATLNLAQTDVQDDLASDSATAALSAKQGKALKALIDALDGKADAAYAHGVTNKGAAFVKGFYKITTNAEGHVTAVEAVSKDDITALGIPASDTTYTEATTAAAGLMSATDKSKLNNIEAGAEVNVIEAVKVDGVEVAITDKAVDIDLSGKVDKEDGKVLSSNDFTSELKAKLEGIDASATADSELTTADIEEICV